MLIHGRNGCNFTEIMDGLLQRETITRLVFVFFLLAHTVIYPRGSPRHGDNSLVTPLATETGLERNKKKKQLSAFLAKLLVRLIRHGAKK